MGAKLEVAIAAGGTAGHINPALALAEELSERGHHVTFFGQSHKLEGTLVPQAGYDFCEIRVTGFDRKMPWTIVPAAWRLLRSASVIGRHFASVGKPDVAVGFGAYVEMPLLMWCGRNGVPYVIHEQNSVPGLANKMGAKKATAICVASPAALPAFEGRVKPGTSLVVTGNPVRRSVVGASREQGRAAFGIDANKTMLLVFGGSLGARHLNQAMARIKQQVLARPDVCVVHSTGKELYDEVRESLSLTEEEARRWQVVPYINNMGEALAASDLVLSRAGASSIAEIAALAVPSVLVPYPLATADHQTTNAKYLVGAGCAALVVDDDLDSPQFDEVLLGLLDDEGRRDAMREQARSLGQDKAASVLADQVESLALV